MGKDKKGNPMPLARPDIQWILFSATYNDEVKQNISVYVKEAM